MDRPRDVAVLVGSLRQASISRRIAQALTLIAPASLALDLVELRDLPMYDEDLEADLPAAWRRLRERIARADALLFITPEYNRSIPGVLKNAIDVASRPYGASVWDGKPGAIVSLSPGGMGAFGANHHLRQSLVFLNWRTRVPSRMEAASSPIRPRASSSTSSWPRSRAGWIASRRRSVHVAPTPRAMIAAAPSPWRPPHEAASRSRHRRRCPHDRARNAYRRLGHAGPRSERRVRRAIPAHQHRRLARVAER
jgi:chromate reductase